MTTQSNAMQNCRSVKTTEEHKMANEIADQLTKIKRLNLQIGFAEASLGTYLEGRRRHFKETKTALEEMPINTDKGKVMLDQMSTLQEETCQLLKKLSKLMHDLDSEEKMLRNLFACRLLV